MNLTRVYGAEILKIVAIFSLVALTNQGQISRTIMLVDQGRIETLVPFLGIWGMAIFSLVVIAFLPSFPVRIFLALLVAVSTFTGRGYQVISGADMSVFDIASLINVASEAGRAAKEYGDDIAIIAVQSALLFLVLIWKVPVMKRLPKRWMLTFSLAPVVLVLAITMVIHKFQGGGNRGLPNQFSPLATTLVYGQVSLTHTVPPREDVDPVLRPNRRIKHVVLLVDESISSEYVDTRDLSSTTGNLAKATQLLGADFGTAVSGSNCSHYSNAILRLGGTRENLVNSVQTNPTIWGYAKKAGYRTIYVDAQHARFKDSMKFQNFMTPLEAELIDEYQSFPGVAANQQDMVLADFLAGRLKNSDVPLFIYANKNGAHFPYDDSYPPDQVHYRPTMRDNDANNEQQRRINSYKNALKWSVDEFFKRLLDQNMLDDTVVFYTSDHGQHIQPGHLTQCSTSDAKPLEAQVPLIVLTGAAELRQMFQHAARENFGKTSHFNLFSSVLFVFGYPNEHIADRFDESLLAPLRGEYEFTSGDIFGMFRTEPTWNSAQH